MTRFYGLPSMAASGQSFEFILGDPRSQSNKKRIRHQSVQDTWRQRRERSKKAIQPTKLWTTSTFSRYPLTRTLPGVAKSKPQLLRISNSEAPTNARSDENYLASDQSHFARTSVLNKKVGSGPSSTPENTVAKVSAPRALQTAQSALNARISFNGYDPFDASIISVDGILNSYISFFATSMWPVYSSKKSAGTFMSSFGCMAVDNEALLYAIAASAAARQSSERRAGARRAFKYTAEDEAYLVYSNKAMASIRNQTQNDPAHLASDESIGVISFLAMCEAVDSGNISNSQTHLSAMLNLVQQRGGCQNISEIWTERIIAADLKAACVSMSSPKLPSLKNMHVKTLIEATIQQTMTVKFSLPTEQMKSTLSQDCISFIVDLRELSQLKSLISDLDSCEDSSTGAYRLQRLVLEHRILKHTDLLSAADFFELCMCLGMLLYINSTIWSNFHPSCAILKVPARRMKSVILEIESTGMTPLYSKMDWLQPWIAWLMFIGAFATYNERERVWYASRLGAICEEMELRNADDFRKILSGTLYMETTFDRWLPEIFSEAISSSQRLQNVEDVSIAF